MPKGMYTQGVCVLLEHPTALDELEVALGSFNICGRRDMSDSWAFGGPTLYLPYRPESNGFIAIDTVDQRWPDDMGDPKVESAIFAAWSMGHFGPFAYPGGLQRAAEHDWTWQTGQTIVDRHKAFIRIRSSYAFGAKDDNPVFPEEYQALPELEFVTKVAASVLDVPGAIGYFNPNGEVLRRQDNLFESLNYAWSNRLPPLDVWSNVRLFKAKPEWSLMDTVGNGQLDIPDVEACFHSQSFDCSKIDAFLRIVSLYMLNNGEIIKDGDTMDGPGEIVWQSRRFENGICAPPRHVLRWLPMDSRPVPGEILNARH